MAPRQKPQPAGPKALTGSGEAKRKAAVLLEALAGLRTTQAAAEELGVALPRYYVLETRMLQAMVDALELKPRGRKRTLEAELKTVLAENRQLRRDVLRLQALYRATQRAVGVKETQLASRGKAKTTKTRRRRKETRGERVVRVLRAPVEPPASSRMAASETPGGQP